MKGDKNEREIDEARQVRKRLYKRNSQRQRNDKQRRVHFEKHYFENGTSAYDGKPIDRLCELEDKIEQGKILELPCEIGDEKFAILPHTDVIVKGKVCTIIYQNGFLIEFAYKSEEYDYTAYTQLLPEELFDTYEEAEAKLREMEGERE